MWSTILKFVPSVFGFGKQWLKNKQIQQSNEYDLERERVRANNKSYRTEFLLLVVFAPIWLIIAAVGESWVYEIWWLLSDIIRSAWNHTFALLPFFGNVPEYQHQSSHYDIIKTTYLYAASNLISEMFQANGVNLSNVWLAFISIIGSIIGGSSVYRQVTKNKSLRQPPDLNSEKSLKPSNRVPRREKHPVRKPVGLKK